MKRHVPVLCAEVVEFLKPTGARFIDATVGSGGHALALLSVVGPGSRLLGIDLDAEAVSLARETLAAFGSGVTLAHDSFAAVGRVARENGFLGASAILFDLGLRSDQLLQGRGFSFREDAPLDMRFDATGYVALPEPRLQALRRLADGRPSYTAADVVARLKADELVEVFTVYGDERYARRIAQAIVEARRRVPFRTTAELAVAVIRALPPAARHRKIHGATRVFQALRMAVNREAESLELGLREAVGLLAPGGRLAVIAYHSGEDRFVKRYFRELGRTGMFRVLTTRPLVPSAGERALNPRSRSAKLRVLEHKPSS